MKFRKLPVVIDAFQWFPEMGTVGGVIVHGGIARIPTLEGDHEVSPGDWIITGVKGENYACKPDVFEQTYEIVE
jgi:hypothetical protein